MWICEETFPTRIKMDRPPAGSHCGTNRECQSHHRDYQHNLLAEREREKERGRETKVWLMSSVWLQGKSDVNI